MANYSITFSCGHTVEKQLYGKQAERDRYINWAQTRGDCAACLSANKAKRFEAVEIEHDLPALTGSEKQVAWARGIRAEKIEIQTYCAQAREKTPADKIELFEEQMAVALQALGEETSASWWIDRRSDAGRLIAAEAFKGAVK